MTGTETRTSMDLVNYNLKNILQEKCPSNLKSYVTCESIDINQYGSILYFNSPSSDVTLLKFEMTDLKESVNDDIKERLKFQLTMIEEQIKEYGVTYNIKLTTIIEVNDNLSIQLKLERGENDVIPEDMIDYLYSLFSRIIKLLPE